MRHSVILTTTASLLCWSANASANGNLSPSSMSDWNGRPYQKTAAIQQGYDIVVKQLGMAVANRPQSVTSMGIHGFQMSIQNTVSFIDSTRYADGSPSPWNLAFSNEDAPDNLWIPAIHIKKGLPLSFEIGGRTGMIQGDTGSVFGTYIRFSPIEGYKRAPDITIQSGYTGYIGNAELAVGTMDASLTIGKAIPFGPLNGVNSSIIKPYVAGGVYLLRADPRLQPDEQSILGITPVSAFSDSEFYTDGYRLYAFDGGIEIESNEIILSLSASYSPSNLLMIEHQFGFAF